MSTPLCMKRMARERATLDKPSSDYFVFFEDDNLRKFEAYVIGPEGTLYEHKFVKLRFQIPDQYPFCPPQCTFVQHSGGRIHPNLYVEGKVCLSILGTWAGEPWAFAMTIETVLITVRSLLDNAPYRHEPGQPDNKDFNAYVQYTTWQSLFLDYLTHERNPSALAFLQAHIAAHTNKIANDLAQQRITNLGITQFSSPYGSYRNSNAKGTGAVVQNYAGLIGDVSEAVGLCTRVVAEKQRKERNEQGVRAENANERVIGKDDEAVVLTDRDSSLRSVTTSMTPTASELTLSSTAPHPQSSKLSAQTIERTIEIIDLT